MLKCLYTIPKTSFIVRSSVFFEGSRLFKDWEDFGPKNLPEYFNKGYKIFQRKLKTFQTLKRPLSMEEEQELTFMMASLIQAKNARYE